MEIMTNVMNNSSMDNIKQDSNIEDEIDEDLKSKHFLKFEYYCCRAYNILRDNANILINLFLIMLSAGMPELKYAHEI